MIVESDDVQRTALEEVVLGVGFVASRRDGASGVISANDVAEVACEYGVDAEFLTMGEGRCVVSCIKDEVGLFGGEIIRICRRPLFEHLVAYAPHEDGGMVAVAQHKVGEVALRPLVEEAGIVVLSLAAAPHVERLVHDDESHGVAHGKEFGGGRIMRATDGVGAHLLEYPELAVEGVLIHRSAKASEVVVLTYTVYLHRLAIEREALGCIEFECAESCGGLVCIHHLASNHDFSPHGINIWRFARPQSWFAHLDYRLYARGLAHYPAFVVEQCVAHGKLGIVRIINLHIHLHLVAFRHHVRAPVGYMGSCSLVEPHMAIDAATAIPSAVGLVAVVHAHCHNILSTIYNIRCKVVAEGTVAIGALTEQCAVDPHLGVHIHTVEVDVELFALIGGIHGE